jgi:hypothetical protein
MIDMNESFPSDWKRKLATLIVVFFCLVLSGSAQTNELWLRKYTDLTTNAMSLQEWCVHLEDASKKISGNCDGINIIVATDSCRTNMQSPWRFAISFYGSSTNPPSFAEVLTTVASCCNVPCKLLDKVAVLGCRQRRFLPLVFSGRCVDAVTLEPITNIAVTSSDDFFPKSLFLTMNSDGNFTCGLAFRLDYVVTPTDSSIFTDDDFPETCQVIHICSPGYCEMVVTNLVWDWRSQWRDRHVEARLLRDTLRPSARNRGNEGQTNSMPTAPK